MFIKVEVKSKDPVVYLIDQKELLIGSSPEICHLKIDHPSVSKKHLKILEEDGKFIAIDQGSTNGTYLKGEQIIPGKRVELLPEIKLRLGLYAFVSLVETADKFERILQLDLNKPSSTKGGGSGENKTQLISMEDFKAAKALAQKKKIEAQKKKKAIESKKKRQDLKRILKAFLLVSVVLYVGYNGNSFFKTGYYNEKLKISSDIEYIFRLFTEKNLKGKYLNTFTLKMKLGGLSTKSFKNILYANFESYIALKNVKIGYLRSLLVIILKVLRKLRQLI